MNIPHALDHIAAQLHVSLGLVQAGAAAFGVAAIGCAAAVVVSGRRRIRAAKKNRAKFITALTNLAALIATGVQASGMWKFFGATMGLPVGFRIFMFSFMEIALLACGLRARANVEEGDDAGIDGVLVWALAMASGVMSSTEANSPQEAVMRVVTSTFVALLWTRDLMAAKKAARAAGGAKKRSGPVRWRITPERIAVWLRLADAVDTDVSTVDAARRVGKFLRQSDRERNGFRWPFTAEARAYRGRMRLMDNGLRHSDPTSLLAELGGLAFTDALERAKSAAAGADRTGPDRPHRRTRADRRTQADQTGPTRTGGPDRSGRTGQADRTADSGPDRTDRTDQTAGPDQQGGPADRTSGPDRQTGPDRPHATDGPADHGGPTDGPDGPQRTDQRTGKAKPATPRTAGRSTPSVEQLEAVCRTWAGEHNVDPARMTRNQILQAIRGRNLTCSNDRAAEVRILLGTKSAGRAWMNWMSQATTDQTGPTADQPDRTETAGPR